MTTIEDLDNRLKNLERAVLQMSKNAVPVTSKTDTAYNKVPQVDNNTSGIQTNSVDIVTTQEGLAETYEETNISITQLEEALVEVYEIIVPQE